MPIKATLFFILYGFLPSVLQLCAVNKKENKGFSVYYSFNCRKQNSSIPLMSTNISLGTQWKHDCTLALLLELMSLSLVLRVQG